MKDTRLCMRKNEKIVLCKEGTQNREEFIISAKEATGSTAICYLAVCGRKKGRLKEFYPKYKKNGEELRLVRREDNLLCGAENDPEAAECFAALAEEYAGTYRTLDETENKDPQNSVFNTFIPSFEIYRGFDGQSPSDSVYIWTPDMSREFVTFDKVIRDIHKAPGKNTEKAMFTILNTMLMLTECLKSLHTAELIHGDITPSNFGLPIRGGRYLTEQVALFDVNSIYSVFSAPTELTGSEGFCAPEVYAGEISNQSDLYSVGAVLFNAVVLNEDIPDGLYDDRYYPELEEIVASSRFINASPVTSNDRFIKRLVSVLKKCLAPSCSARIKDCGELMTELKKTILYLLPAQYSEYTDFSNEVVLAKIDKELGSYKESDALAAIRELLYTHPLYETGGETVRVAILGFGVYGRMFLNQCLQAGQLPGLFPEITVIANDAAVCRDEYLESCPAVSEFFDIDGVSCGKESYGGISFVSPEKVVFSDSKAKSKDLLRKLFADGGLPQYFFAALPDEVRCLAAAKAFRELADEAGAACTSSYVCYGKRQIKRANVVPVYVTEKAGESELHDEITRLAYNVYLTWKRPLDLNRGVKSEAGKFREKRSRDEAMTCALSVRGKLHYMGIDISAAPSADELKKAAEKYAALIRSDREKAAALVQAEHRRWVTEKITDGWTRREKLADCTVTSVYDRRKKTHPCIVRSRADFNLEKNYKTAGEWNKSKWDSVCTEDASLDELDAVSVGLHRAFRKKAQEIRNSYSLRGTDASRIYILLSGDEKATFAFNEFLICLERIWNGEPAQTRMYKKLKEDFTDSINGHPCREEILGYLKNIDKNAFPIIGGCRFRDYKATDKNLVFSLPFVLTYREDLSMLIPFSTGSNSRRFANVASVTLVNPRSVSYVCLVRNAKELPEITDTVENLLSYMAQKDLKASLRFWFLCASPGIQLGAANDLCTEIKELAADKRIKSAEALFYTDEADIPELLARNADEADIYEKNDTYLSALLSGAGYYTDRDSFLFRSAQKTFICSEGCRWLTYVRGEQYLTVADMFSFSSSAGVMSALPEFSADYAELWKLYRKNTGAWKDMCELLDEAARKNDLISSFIIPEDLSSPEKYEFIFPDGVREGYQTVIAYLRDAACVITPASFVEYRSAGSCRAVIFTSSENANAVQRLFADPQKFFRPSDISFAAKPRSLDVVFNGLTVSGGRLPQGKTDRATESRKKITETLKGLEEKHYISNLVIEENGAVSLVFATPQVKHLMTNAGRLLEVYVYHKALDAGFDNVVTGYEVNWYGSDVKSEFDCIVTSGFRSLVIECKAQNKLEQEYYYKLSGLAAQFGVNAVPVLVCDIPLTGNSSCTAGNSMQIRRGKFMDVITVYKRDEVNNIGSILKSIINGKYTAEDE